MSSLRDRLDVVVVAATLLIVTVAFGAYLEHRQAVGDTRAEKQRTAICSILAALPPSPPPSLQAARVVFARPGHPNDCRPVAHPVPTGRRATPTPAPQVVIVLPPASGRAQPTASAPSAKRPSAPSSTPSHTSSPSPSPSPSCVLIVICP